jgi:lipopolysaccharide assembly outer membrane protein LptD (OstA)
VRRRLAAGVALVIWAGTPPAAFADLPTLSRSEAPVELTCDALEYESEGELYVARGSVHIRQGERSVSADWMAFSGVTQQGVASGNVVFKDGEDTLYAEFIEFDVSTLEGVVFEARFASEEDRLRMEGAVIEKTGEDTYRFEEGMFTSCRCPDDGRDPWRIRASKADLEIGGYGTARNTTFEILGVPVVWLPWMIYPLKTERQSGFLLPGFGLGKRHGFEVGVPFLWTAGDQVNVIMTPQWLEKRGVKGDVEVEYVYGQRSGGHLFAAFLSDREIDPNTPAYPYDRAVAGRQDFFLPAGWRAKTDFRFVSDNQYVQDFEKLGTEGDDRFLESRAFAAKSVGGAGRTGLVGSAVTADDLQSPDDSDRDRYLLQRLPDLAFSLLPGPLPWVSHVAPALGVHYTHFWPWDRAAEQLPLASEVDGGAEVVGDDIFLDTGIDALPDARERGIGGDPHRDNAVALGGTGGSEGDGLFQEGEPLGDRGHRLLLTPRLGVPWRLGDVVELYPEVGWHQTLYQTDAQGFEERGLFTGRVDLRTRLRRRFGGGLVHLIEPRLGYALITGEGQATNPLFVPRTAVPQVRVRQFELDNVVRDPADRIRRFNGITLGVGNRIYDNPSGGGAPRLLADLSVSGQYEFSEGEFGSLLLEGRTYPWGGLATRFNFGFDLEAAAVDEALAQFAWSFAGGHGVALSYRYLRTVPRFFEDFAANDRFEDFEEPFDQINQVNLYLRFAFTQSWIATYEVAYTFEESLLLANEGGLEYHSRCRCWAIRLEVSQDRVRGAQFNLLYKLTGLGGRGRFQRAGRLGGELLDGF